MIRKKIGWWLRCLADRIDYEHSFACATPYTFTIENKVGVVLREDGKGCPIWYYRPQRELVHKEADNPL